MKKRQIKILIFFMAISLMNCKSTQKNLDDYKEINSTFTKAEIQDLNKIVDFFNASICKLEEHSNKSINECYNQFFEELKNNFTNPQLQILQISLEEQKLFLANLNASTLNEIWSTGKTWSKNSDTLETKIFYHLGKYTQFLQKFGKENEKANQYYKSIMTFAEPSPSVLSDILMNDKEYDMNDKRIQLLIAIHYLTLNERRSYQFIKNDAIQ